MSFMFNHLEHLRLVYLPSLSPWGTAHHPSMIVVGDAHPDRVVIASRMPIGACRPGSGVHRGPTRSRGARRSSDRPECAGPAWPPCGCSGLPPRERLRSPRGPDPGRFGIGGHRKSWRPRRPGRPRAGVSDRRACGVRRERSARSAPPFSRPRLVIGNPGCDQKAGGHLVGEATEVVVDLDLEAHEPGGVAVQLIE